MLYNISSVEKKRKLLRSKSVRAKHATFVFILQGFLFLMLLLLFGGSGLLYGSVKGMIESAPDTPLSQPSNTSSVIYNCNEKEVQRLYDYTSNRINMSATEIPENLAHAFVAIEDERFYTHNGVDLKGILRALEHDLATGTLSQGASTITQQLIKNTSFNVGGESNRLAKIKRKVQEQYLAIQQHNSHDRDEILSYYLNTINLGKGNLGVQTAATYYFGKSLDKLSISECAVLAAITKNPSALNPVDHPEENNERRKVVLEKMLQQGYIKNEEYQTALEEDSYATITKNSKNRKTSVYSYFTDALILQIVSDLQTQLGYTQSQAYNLIYRGGLQIYSTQDTELQKIANEVINDASNYPVDTQYSLEYTLEVKHTDGTIDKYTEKDLKQYFIKKTKDENYSTIYDTTKEYKKAVKKFRKSVLAEGDTVVSETIHHSLEPQLSYSLIDQTTGQVKVLVGGRGEKYDDLALNRATAVERQPGSTFKILSTYAPAIDSGSMTLATVFDDAPYAYENGVKVTNYTKGKYEGLLDLRDAIIESNNIVAVKALTEITPEVGYNYLLQLGFTTLVSNRVNANGGLESDVNQSLSLGGITDGVTNVEITAAYAAIANGGTYHKPYLYTKVLDSEGNVLLENKTESTVVMKESTSWLLTDAMKDVVQKGTGKEAQLSSDMAVAGKTGTTSNNYDYWFCGYTPYYTASIWTGYDYNQSFENDKDYHKVIWAKIMDKIIDKKNQKSKDFPKCSDIVKATVCKESGLLPVDKVCENDPESKKSSKNSMIHTEYFAKDTVPTEECDVHVSVTVCKDTGATATSYCPHPVVKIYRKASSKASSSTDDAPYLLPSGLTKKICTVHTKEWKEKEEAKKQKEKEKKEKEKQKKDAQQAQGSPDAEQSPSGNSNSSGGSSDNTDLSLDDISSQIDEILNH